LAKRWWTYFLLLPVLLAILHFLTELLARALQ
jgi:hypothetical protein